MSAANHPTFQSPPDPKIKVWRYMSIARFIWLLQSEALYFARSDLLGDPFEGYYTQPMLALKEHMVEFYEKQNAEMGSEKARELAEQIYHMQVTYAANIRRTLYVNCWHMNSEESLAMWKLYALQHESVCIQSTFEALQSVLPENCFLGTVKYIDYYSDLIKTDNLLQFIVHKRHSFVHEREVRAVIWDGTTIKNFTEPSDSLEPAKIIRIDLSKLIQNVYVSPTSEPLLKDVVEGVISKYGLCAPVHRSLALDGPAY